jgi:hypothetical protein
VYTPTSWYRCAELWVVLTSAVIDSDGIWQELLKKKIAEQSDPLPGHS